MRHGEFLAMTAAAIAATSCSAQTADRRAAREAPREATTMNEATPNVASAPGEPIADLPWSRGRGFATLDEYLAHLESNGAIGLPYYREVRPGVYELVTTMRPPPPPETFTRAQLRERFGFTR